jgi:antirestriction protein ArdC
MSNQAIYDKVFAGVLEALSRGVVAWRKPWGQGGASARLPMNAATGKQYHGGNIIALWAQAQLRGYGSCGWVTFRQAVDAGCVVREGQKGTPVYYFTKKEKENKDTGEVETFWFARGYTVFNLDQLADLSGRGGSLLTLRARVDGVARPSSAERIAACEAMVSATGAKIIHGGPQASYHLRADEIHMPELASFESGSGYYGTLFHELTHWTGHESRLARPIANAFGTPDYALEELVAELGAAILGARFGVESIDQSAAYIHHWQQRLSGQDGPRLLAMCAAQAAKAAEYVAPESAGVSDTDHAEAA